MRNKKLAVLGVAALTMTLATGCAKPPQQEIDALKAAMSSPPSRPRRRSTPPMPGAARSRR